MKATQSLRDIGKSLSSSAVDINNRNKDEKRTLREFHAYDAYGLHLNSELPLPELIPSSLAGVPDVLIRLAPFDLSALDIDKSERNIVSTQEGTYFYWKNFGAFLVCNGNTILVHPETGIPFQFVRIPLLGAVLGTLLHQRGLFTLHASVVNFNGHAVAFLGEKGAGKSTMAAALYKSGHAVIADDILAVDLNQSGQLMVLPGFPQFKLSSSVIAELEGNPNEIFEIHPQLAKLAFRPNIDFLQVPLPLKKIYVLTEGTYISSATLSARDAFMQLMIHSYVARFLGEGGSGIKHFNHCQRLVHEVPVCHLQRPRDLSQLSSVVKFVERDYNRPV